MTLPPLNRGITVQRQRATDPVDPLDGGRRNQARHNVRPEGRIGFHVVEIPMHVNDLHATQLHLLGIDHTQLTYRFQGRQFRLTDVAGKVAEAILA